MHGRRRLSGRNPMTVCPGGSGFRIALDDFSVQLRRLVGSSGSVKIDPGLPISSLPLESQELEEVDPDTLLEAFTGD